MPNPVMVDASECRRRLRQLLDGRDVADVADRLGWSPQRLQAVLQARRISQDTADQIAELHTTLLRGGPAVKGQIPGWLWRQPVDQESVVAAAGGGVPWHHLPPAVRLEAVWLHMKWGLSARASADRLRISERVVFRWRARARRLATGRS